MNLIDYLLEKCQHDLSLAKNEAVNSKEIVLLNDAMNIIQQIKYDRANK